MKTILTDKERTKAYEDLMKQSLRSQDAEAVLQYARAIEAAIIQKIGEAVAAKRWHDEFACWEFADTHDMWAGYYDYEPLYAIPFIEVSE